VGKPGQPSLLVWQIDEEDEKGSKYKRDKSLGILCQQFIGLFVTWRRVISLEQAAKQISIKEEEMLLGNTLPVEEQFIDLNQKMTEQDEQILLGQDVVEPEEAQKLKTKIRRLYDIANVLQSIGLIEKTNHTYNKKPAFRWIGIHGVHEFVKELADERVSMNL
jgi:predicted ATP-dependent Lon-type protease